MSNADIADCAVSERVSVNLMKAQIQPQTSTSTLTAIMKHSNDDNNNVPIKLEMSSHTKNQFTEQIS